MTDSKNVRVTVSMPKSQVERMERLAAKMGLSRNAFMQVALGEYMTNKELVSEDMILKAVENIVREAMEEKQNVLSID